MSEESDNLKFWDALYDVLSDSSSNLPYAEEPDRVHWNHPDEEWKNQTELDNLEEEVTGEIDEMIVFFCENKEWPKKNTNNAIFFLEKRIDWALSQIRLFLILDPETGDTLIPRSNCSGWKLISWFLIDVYKQRFPSKPELPLVFSSGGESN